MDRIGMDFDSYSQYCERVLEPVLEQYCDNCAGLIINSKRKEIIWNYYKEFNEYCKKHYMQECNHLLDRHKVVACYMYAIEEAHIIVSSQSLQYGDESHLMLNERLSFCFGMTMLRALIMDLVDDIKDEKLRLKAEKAFDNGFYFPECNHGNYKNNFLSQLYFTYREKTYNILLLATSLHSLEIFTLVKNGLQEDLFKISNS